MGGRRLLTVAVTAGVVVLAGIAPAAADPARPTVDPAASTPTAPYPGGPPEGHAPDGRTVGGEQLGTRQEVVANGAPPLPPGIAAAGWLVADADSGTVLAARDPHGRFYPASTLKTLTLLTLAHRLDPDEVVAGTREDENIEGSRVGLVAGGRYPVSLLFQALILQSGNDAANALARAAGGVDATVAAMNETAERLGAFDTVAGTPSGLDVAGQSSSPYDLALIFRALVDDPTTAAVLAVRTARMPPVPGRSPGWQIQSQNPLLSRYAGDLGGKTGFTDAARHTFVTAAARNGHRLVVSVMDTENRPLRAPDQAALLLDWGFSLPAGTRGVGRLVTPEEAAALITPPTVAGAAVGRHAPTRTGTTTGPPRQLPPLLVALLGAGALALAALTVTARRRALRSATAPGAGTRSTVTPPAPSPPEETPPRSAGGSPSTRP